MKVDRPATEATRLGKARPGNHPSSSSEQLVAEDAIRRLAATALGVALVPQRLKLPGGACVDIDGFHAGPPATLVELYARQGELRGAQPKKLRADAFKLLATRELLYPGARLVLVVASEDAERSFYTGWTKEALGALGIELCRVSLDSALRATLATAQKRQHMGNTVAGDDESFE